MALVLDIGSLGDIQSFSGLTRAIASWLDRDDLDARVPYFIALAEARFRRLITRTEREATVALPSALPADFDSVRSIHLTDEPGSVLTAVSPAVYRERYASAEWTGRPRVYVVDAGQILTGPAPDRDYSAVLIYNRKIPSLAASNQTNWLLDDHPDLYLFGALLQAEFFGWNDERLPLIKAAVDEQIEEINMAGARRRYGSGPLVAQSPVREGAGRAVWR